MTKNNTAVITSSWKNISICFFPLCCGRVEMRNERMHPCQQPPLCRNLGILFCLKHGVQLDGWSFFLLEILTQSWATFTGIVKSIKFDECLTLVKYWCAYWKERIAPIWVAFNSKTLAWKSLKKWAIPRNCIGRNLVLENGGTLALINRNIKQLFLRFFIAFPA